MDPELVRPFENLIAYAGAIVPLATALPPLLVHFRRTDSSRPAAVLFWVPAPAVLAAIALETCSLWRHSALPGAFSAFVLLTCGALIPAYVLLGWNLPRVLDRDIAAADRRRLEDLTKTKAIEVPSLLDPDAPA